MGSKKLLVDVLDGSGSHDQESAGVPLPDQMRRGPGRRIGPPVTFAASRRFDADGTRLLVDISGEIDLITAPALANALVLGPDDRWPHHAVTDLVVDLRLVTFLSAAGLRVLDQAHRQCRRDGVSLWIVADQSAVTRPLRLTGLDRTLKIRQTVEVVTPTKPPGGVMRTEPVDAGNAPDLLIHDELLKAVAQGDQEAFARFYDIVAPAVVGVVRAVVRDPVDAEKVTAEVFVELWRTAARYTPNRGGAIAWALSVAHRRAVDRVRSGRRTGQPGEQAPYPREPGSVHRGLDELNALDRQAILLAFYDARTYREVAESLTVAPGTVRHRLRDGLRRLSEGRTRRVEPEPAPATRSARSEATTSGD